MQSQNLVAHCLGFLLVGTGHQGHCSFVQMMQRGIVPTVQYLLSTESCLFVFEMI